MTQNYKCDYCGKTFVKEKTLTVHVCEKKRRYLAKSEKHVQNGMLVYQKFYQIHQKSGKQKTFDDFVASPYYTAFIKFGSFLVNTNPIYPDKFIDYVLTSGIKLDHWCRDELYEKYLYELIRSEPADGAVQRTIQHMMDWADNNDASWEHYFKYVNLNRAVHDIKEGMISPWLVLNTKCGKEMLRNMNDEQIEMVAPYVDPQFWLSKFKKYPADKQLVKDIVSEAKIQ